MALEKDQDSNTLRWEVSVTLSSNQPVIGSKIFTTETKLVNSYHTTGSPPPPPHSFVYTWYRHNIPCSVHRHKLATVQCTACVKLNASIEKSYHCSSKCFSDAWNKHRRYHRRTPYADRKNSTDNQQDVKKLRSSGSWPNLIEGSVIDENAIMVEEDNIWIKVGSSNAYIPTLSDCDFRLRLHSAAVDSSLGTRLSLDNIVVTDPVIKPSRPPRKMIHLRNTLNSNLKAQSSNDVVFSVLTYNILADSLSINALEYCPRWALAWEYRQEILLEEIIKYDADILCLQEVQCDHFENFFEPELKKLGYSVMYKKRTGSGLFLGETEKSTNHGCATFYQSKLFKEIMKYELEFDKEASSVVNALEPKIKFIGSHRLTSKDNVALVVVLESLQNGSNRDAFQSRICVANIHTHWSKGHEDVTLFQVVHLVNGLEKIAQSQQIPLIICGDFNSRPGSDTHNFVVKGRANCVSEKANDPLGIFQYLKLHHSLSLVSAYSSFLHSDGVEEQRRKMNSQTSEPAFTNFTNKFFGTLDYIFYTDKSLIVESLLELVERESIGNKCIPSPTWPSDHIALMASFRLRPPSHWRPSPPPFPLNPWHLAALRQHWFLL
ncbi:carbon catabolite repressor protein 4 homolog 1-like [Castanea sativa]|uniref:carbon catabolite repressor protein 4 homolog 1-like n=1 Tax=Castanea sativa TaxID=21020 RepID=UPI003F64A677